METLKVAIEVNINFSESTKSFLSSLFGGSPAPTAPVAPAVNQTAQEPKKPVEQKPTAPTKPATEEKPAAPAKPASAAPASPAGSTIKIDQVRKALAEKVNDHRAEIKEKLEELGAPSVTKLAPEKYQEMYDFLTSL